MEARSVRFAATARSLGDVARARGLVVPGFRSPPRRPGVDRLLRRGAEPVVSVRIRGRPWTAVLADMIEGIVVANELDPSAAARCRTALWAAVEDERLHADADPFRAATPSSGTDHAAA